MGVGKKSGFVVILLVLFVFCGLFVSASWFSDFLGKITGNVVVVSTPVGHVQYVNGNAGQFVSDNHYYVYNFSNPMNVSNVTINLSSVDSVKCNVSLSSIYLDGSYHVFRLNEMVSSSAGKLFSYSIPVSSAIKGIAINSTGACDIYQVMNFNNLFAIGQYPFLPIVNQTLMVSPIVAPNSGINLSLIRNMEVGGINLSFSVSSNPSCNVSVYAVSDSYVKFIGSFDLKSVGATGRALSRSYIIASPVSDNKIVINSTATGTGASRKYCFAGNITFTNVTVSGQITSCTPSWSCGVWSSCANGAKARTCVDSNMCGITSGKPSESDICPVDNCATRCGSNGTGVVVPSIVSAPASCYFGESCTNNISIARSLGDSGYDISWIYSYKDGTNNTVCACNGTNVLDGKIVRVNSVGDFGSVYNLPVFVNDSSGKVVDHINVLVFAFNGSNRSGYSTPDSINIGYRCDSGCNVLGDKRAAELGETNKYQTCVPISATFCYNWSANMTCGVGYRFDNGQKDCVATGNTFNCNGDGMFCSKRLSFAHADIQSSLKCSLSSEDCFKCGDGYLYSSDSGKCEKVGCVSNCSSIGGTCKANDFNSAGTGLVVNASGECCTDDLCFVCQSGYHVNNGSCVSDSCAGSIPHGENFTIGANTTNSPSVNMTWNYNISGSPGACQWSCQSGFRKNISDNLSCVWGLAACSEVGGICSSVNLTGGILVSSATCASGSCYTCDQDHGYMINGSVCSFGCNGNKVWNGVGCVNTKPGCNGCVLNNRCIGNDTLRIVRVNINGNKFYCDSINSDQFLPLVADNQTCSYNAQCASNLCGADQKCLNIAREVRQSSGIMKSIYCWFSTGFSFNSAAYNQCLAQQGA